MERKIFGLIASLNNKTTSPSLPLKGRKNLKSADEDLS